MRHLWLGAHILGFIMWMGGGFAAMIVGTSLRKRSRDQVSTLVEVLDVLHRRLVLPGAMLVVVSGLILTLRLYSGATSVNGFPRPLMVMQGAGLLAAVIVMVVAFPTMGRLARLDPAGEHAPLFQSLSRKMGVAGMLSGMLAMIALIGGVLLR